MQVQGYRDTAAIGPCDLVIVALKTTSNAALPDLLRPLVREGTMLLTLQNGLGNEEFLAEHFGAERVLGGLCFVGLNRIAPGVIEQYDVGRIALGEHQRAPQSRTRAVAEQFNAAGIRCTVVEDLGLERWRKLVWNIPFNGLAVAAGGVHTATILGDRALREVTLSLMAETIDAANRCGFPLMPTEAETQLTRTVAMGDYRPSTLIDFEEGRPLELEAIWGAPLRQAVAAGAHVPQLAMLHALLGRLDQRRNGG